MKYIMALDQGTTSCRCILFDRAGNPCAQAQEEFTQYYPHPGWVEHDAVEIWNCQYKVARTAMKKLGVSACDIAGIGITNQRETTVVWDRLTGQPIYNAIVWQCHRTAEYIDELKSRGCEQMIREKTGLIPDAYFSASKVRWILDHVAGARERAERGELLFGTIDTWLIWKLTNGKCHVTDHTNASRTMLYNIHDLCWDEELLELLGVPHAMLPEVKESSCMYGTTDPALFGEAIPIGGAAGDQQAALFGQCCFHPGEAKNTYGTGCFLLMNTGETPILSKNGLLTTIAVGIDGRVEYALEGSVFIGGAVIQWLRDSLRVIDRSADSEYFAYDAGDTEDIYFVPAFSGMGAPYWNQYSRGCLFGLTRGSEKRHIVRASLEAIAYQTMDVCRAMEHDAGIPIESLRADGGAANNRFLMQFQSDILNTNIQCPKCTETTALGAAYLAGLAVGFWSSREDIMETRQTTKTYFPRMDEGTRERKTQGWHAAVSCTLAWGDTWRATMNRFAEKGGEQ